jgi:hypothetical protein
VERLACEETHLGFIRALFASEPRRDELNSDPVQNDLVHQLIEAAEGSIFQEIAIKDFVDESGWSRPEKELRLAHALAVVRRMRPDVFDTARKIGMRQTG